MTYLINVLKATKWVGHSVTTVKTYIFTVVAGMICAIAGTVIFFTTASAISSTGPDSNEFANNARYALQHGSQLVIDQITVPVYYPYDPGSITVTASDFDFEGRGAGNGRASVSFNGTAYTKGPIKTFTLGSFQKDQLTGYYVANIVAQINTNVTTDRLVNYRLNVPNPGLIGYLASSGSHFGIANQSRCSSMKCGIYYNYSIPFATPCSITTNRTVAAAIYDGDNGNPGVQPTNFWVRVYDETSGSFITHTLSGSEGNGGTASYRFIVQPGHKYQFRVYNVFTNNVLQFALPYDSINYVNNCKDYNLTPTLSVNRTIGESGGNVNVTPSVSNVGYGPSIDTKWQISTIAFAPGVGIPVATQNSVEPCTYFRSKLALNCEVEPGNSGIGSFSSAANAVFTKKSGDNWGVKSLEMGDYPAGTRLCYALSLQARSYTSTEWTHSNLRCVILGKTPKVQVWGGDLMVGRSFSGNNSAVSSQVVTSTSTKTLGGVSKTFGSWIEYGIFATGSISGAASKAGFAGPDGMANATVCAYSVLSFSNSNGNSCSNSSPKLGNYSTSQPIPSVSGSFSQSGSAITVNHLIPNDLLVSSGMYVGTRNGDLRLDGGMLAPRKSVIIKVSGTVTIAGNLIYNNDNGGAGYKDITELPQLVIIANKIVINSGVTNVDAWLIADGKDGIIETCDTGSPSFNLTGNNRLTINKCNNQLTVNGPVMAKQLWLRRTAGSGTGASSGDPAEVFNLRADAYLWSAARSIDLGRAQTVYSTELPPRF